MSAKRTARDDVACHICVLSSPAHFFAALLRLGRDSVETGCRQALDRLGHMRQGRRRPRPRSSARLIKRYGRWGIRDEHACTCEFCAARPSLQRGANGGKQGNLTSIGYRIYKPIASLSASYTFNASDVEDALRRDGCLVYMDAERQAFWCFYLASKDTAKNTAEQLGLDQTLEICGYALGLVEEGTFEPISLQKSRQLGTNPINTPSSSSSSGSALDRATQLLNLTNTSSSVAPEGDAKMTGTTPLDLKAHLSIPTHEVYRYFINGVVSSLVTAFCRQVGAVPLDHRNVLLPRDVDQFNTTGNTETCICPSVVATFRVYLTTTGSLVITLLVSSLQGLVASADALRWNGLTPGASVLTAPFGVFGFVHGVKEGDGPPADTSHGQSPDTQLSRARPELSDKFLHWKSICSRVMQMRGISPALLDGCSWLMVQFTKSKLWESLLDGKRTPVATTSPTAPWPAVLCFRKSWQSEPGRVGPGHFSAAQGGESYDPLSHAATWFQQSAERDESLSRRKQDREAMVNRDSTETDGQTRPINQQSPLALHRPGHAGAAAAAGGTMYPTPPDGIPAGVVDPFDSSSSNNNANRNNNNNSNNNIQSPANHQAPTLVTDMDVAMSQDGPSVTNSLPGGSAGHGDGGSGGWAAPDQKREPIFLEGDNLFGDIGDDMFENNELTDADFNFFDERPGHDELDLSALQDIGTAIEMTTSMNQASLALERSYVEFQEVPAMVKTAPQFAKPELRHARSILVDENRQGTPDTGSKNQMTVPGTKRHQTPFDPDTVYKKVRAADITPALQHWRGLQGPPASPRSRRGSVFEKVDFDPSLSLVAKKYQESGPFYYSLSLDRKCRDSQQHVDDGGGLLSTRTPGQGAKSSQTARDSNDANYGVLMTRINGGVDTVPLLQETIKREDVESDSDDLSLVSDQDDSSEDLDEPSSPTKSHVFRRRLDDDVASMAASFKDLESTTAAESPSYGPNELTHLSIMEREKGEVSVTKFFSDADPAPLHISLSDDVYVAVAQILAEQACTGTLQLDAATSLLASSPVPLDTRRSLIAEARRAMESLKGTLPRSLSGAHDCPFRTLMEVQDVPWLGQPSRLPPRPAGQEIIRPSIFQLPPPHLEVRRCETKLSVLPAAIPFWESLGLGPSFGTKDVCAVSIFPELEGMADHAAAFLDRMQSMYESLKLGTFGKMPTISGLANGLLGCEGTQSSMELDGMCSGSSFSGYMHMLAEVMAGAETTEKNFVVFFVYSLEKPGSAVDCCAGFQELFERYRKGLMERRKPVLNELVLQLIPLSYVALDSTLSVLSPAEYATLSFAVYDRCTMFGGPMPAPAIVLEQSLPHLIKFQPSPTPSPNLLQENSNMHLAYCQSVDERWITAAWTDNRGLRQMTASYCLGRRGRPLSRPVASVIQEMWTTTTELISLLKVQWRIIVTKCGVIDVSEVETWKEASREDRSIGASLVIMTADTNPSLQLIPPAVKLPVAASSVLYTTPAATPQPVGVVSPEQSGAPGALATGPPTPGGGDTAMNSDADADATLVDVTDTTWGAVLSHRLSNSASLTDVSPALASGYLVKRSGARPDDPPAIMEVNMIHGDQTPRAGNMRVYELGLREMLGAFRGLGTVARLRGVVDREVDVRPWHVAVAEKAARALYQLL